MRHTLSALILSSLATSRITYLVLMCHLLPHENVSLVTSGNLGFLKINYLALKDFFSTLYVKPIDLVF